MKSLSHNFTTKWKTQGIMLIVTALVMKLKFSACQKPSIFNQSRDAHHYRPKPAGLLSGIVLRTVPHSKLLQDQALWSYMGPSRSTECLLQGRDFTGSEGFSASHGRYSVPYRTGPCMSLFSRTSSIIWPPLKMLLRLPCNIPVGHSKLLWKSMPGSQENQFHCWIYFPSWKADWSIW